MPWFVPLLIGLALQALAYLLMPKQTAARQKPEAMEDPTASAGRRIVAIFGDITEASPNILWFGEKAIGEYTVSA